MSDDEEADFESGFDPKTKVAQPKAEPKVAEPKEAEPKEAEPEPKTEVQTEDAATDDKPVDAAKPAKPKFVKLTQEELDKLRAATTDQGKQLSKAFGTIGSLTAQLNALKDKDKPAAPEAKPVVLSDVQKTAVEELDDLHPEWRKIIDAGDKPDPANPFRTWLKTRPQEYQDRINNTNSARVISRAIDMFKEATEKKPAASAQPAQAKPAAEDTAAAARRDRIASAVPPKTAGGAPPKSKTTDDEFEAGFAEG